MDGYNGWANYPTWCVHMWLTNDEGTYGYVMELTEESPKAGALATVLEDWVTRELTPDLGASFAADVLGWGLGQVDWYEIAEALREGRG